MYTSIYVRARMYLCIHEKTCVWTECIDIQIYLRVYICTHRYISKHMYIRVYLKRPECGERNSGFEQIDSKTLIYPWMIREKTCMWRKIVVRSRFVGKYVYLRARLCLFNQGTHVYLRARLCLFKICMWREIVVRSRFVYTGIYVCPSIYMCTHVYI